MKQFFIFLIKKIIPRKILRFFFPSRIKEPLKINSFFKISDPIAGKDFFMFMREDSFIEVVVFYNGLYGEWEKESLKIWAELSKISNIIIDIGSNTGIYALVAKNNNPDANVIAIEPIGINFSVLSKNVVENNFNIFTEQIALSDHDGTAKMFMLKDRLNYMTSVNDDRYAIHPEIKGDSKVIEIEVPIKTFDFIQSKYQLSSVDLIKIDVEGHEISVLSGMMDFIKENKPTILIEVINDEIAAELEIMFTKIGYLFISIDEINISKPVNNLWNNDHHNFLICKKEIVSFLQNKNLVS